MDELTSLSFCETAGNLPRAQESERASRTKRHMRCTDRRMHMQIYGAALRESALLPSNRPKAVGSRMLVMGIN